MAANYCTDLAQYIYSQLLDRKEDPPNVEVLTKLLETLFFASLKSEERQAISCRVAFINRIRPDPYPPARILASRWRVFPLKNDLPLSVGNIAKLAAAADPWGSTLAVDVNDDHELRIWGLIDQSVHYSAFTVREAESGAQMPGMFQVSIEGVGEIAVYKTYLLLGGLKQQSLVTGQLPVFQYGPVRSKLLKSISEFQETVKAEVGARIYQQREHWDASLEEMWISSLCRLLINIHRLQTWRRGTHLEQNRWPKPEIFSGL
jgi:hypothetical protein